MRPSSRVVNKEKITTREKHMNVMKSCSRRILSWSLIFFIIVAMMVMFSGYAAWRFLFSSLPMPVLHEAAAQHPEFQRGLDQIRPWIDYAEHFFIPVTGGVCLLLALVFWLILRRSIFKVAFRAGFFAARDSGKPKDAADRDRRKADAARRPSADDVGPDPRESEADRQARAQRLYLHLLSVLQREGRMVDFFTEDLTPYDDGQIGVAVRNIHENCAKTLQKYLKPKAVIENQEGEEIVVPKNFDVDAIKVTGNVSGEPPFKGILRHRGWQAGRIELPVLNPGHNPRIIAPAEVEIL
jgi:hypothetical protein